MRFQISEFNVEHDSLRKLNDVPGKIVLTGHIIDGPDIRSSYQKLKVKIDDARSILLVSVGRYPEYHYLDTIKVTGLLKTPAVTEDFNYKNYLLKDGIYSIMDFPKAELISNNHTYNPLTFSYEKILFVKEKLEQSINANFSLPQNVMLDGIVFGNDKNFPKDLKNKFNQEGLSHVTAVSGSNIVILISTLMVLLLALGLWRGQAFYFSVIFIWLYIVLIGFPESGIRAAIMGSIALLAQKLGRQNTSSRVLVLAGATMLFENPWLLLYDVGFQLSFLASMGIIYLKPLIDASLDRLKSAMISFERSKNIISFSTNKKSKIAIIFNSGLKGLGDIISVTLSAQIFTLPIIIYNFGTVSLVALLTNLLILPTIPLLMSFGFLAALFGTFSHFLAWVFALPCYALLFYFLKILDIFNQPWAVKSLINISLVWFLMYYAVLFIVIWFLQKKLKPKFLGY